MGRFGRSGRSFLSLLSVSGRSKMPQEANAPINAFKDKLDRETATTLHSQMAPTHGRHGRILNVSMDRTLSASLAFAASQLLERAQDQNDKFKISNIRGRDQLNRHIPID